MSLTNELNFLLRDLQARSPKGYAAGLHIRFAAPLLSFYTYSEEWLRLYTSRAYALRDPTIFWGLSCEGTTRWSEIELPDPFDIFGQAAEFGLRFGCGVSCGPLTSRTIVGAARDDREFEDDEIAAIQAIVLQMHMIAEPPEELTRAQVEALKCIADGDRHIAAAARLGISESALKARLSAARGKMLARTTSEAIQRAKDYRLI
jgi:LuxR family transcriptional regulator, quorum-sensing system regulator SdiA